MLSTPFEELLATPGVGQKKICSLITLLSRATKDLPPEDPFGLDAMDENRQGGRPAGQSRQHDESFDPSMVSEAHWIQWRNTVKRHHLGQLKLGRLAPSLQTLPTVVWHTPLAEYVDLSLSDLRQLKTHGEKRVRAILEVFWIVQEALGSAQVKDHLEIQLVPKFVPNVERWTAAALVDSRLPTARAMRTALVDPLLAQINVDAGTTVWRLAADRLGVKGTVKTVRQLAKRMSVTRARVYQLLEECGKIMAVRWPEGEPLLAALGERIHTGAARDDAVQMCDTLLALCYPKMSHVVRHALGRSRVAAAVADAD